MVDVFQVDFKRTRSICILMVFLDFGCCYNYVYVISTLVQYIFGIPRVTRSTKLSSLYGLFYLDNDDIDKAACFYIELKVIAVNYGAEVI